MKKFISVFLVLIAFSFANVAQAESYQKISDVKYLDVSGVDPNLVSLDAYIPKNKTGAKMPIIIFVHGGGWWTGDKVGAAREKPEYFTSLGYIFVSVNYRLSPDPHITFRTPNHLPDRIKYPVQQEDAAAAVAYVYNNAERFGGDKTRIALMGHSAGAQIVSLISTDERFLQKQGMKLTDLKALVSLDAVFSYDITEGATRKENARYLYLNAFGENEEVWKRASVVNHISTGKNIPPSLIVSQQVRQSNKSATNLVKQLKDSGYISYHYVAEGMDHEDINKKLGENNDLTKAVTQFLQKYL